MSNLNAILNATSLSRLMLAMQPEEEVTLQRDPSIDAVNVILVRYIRGHEVELQKNLLARDIMSQPWEAVILGEVKRMYLEMEVANDRD